MCLVKVRQDYDEEDDVYVRRVRRPASRSETRVAYSPRASARETRTRVSQTYITEAPRPHHAIEDRPRAQYLAGPPQHVGGGERVHVHQTFHQSAPISRELPREIPPPAPMPPPPPPEPVIVKEKEVIIEKKVEKRPPSVVENKSRLEIVSVEHSDPKPSHSNVSRKHSRHGSKASESVRGSERREYDGVIVERERNIHTKRYVPESARRSVPEYETYRYIEAPPVKKEVRHLLEDNPRRSTGGLFKERDRERERVVIDYGGSRRRREYN